MNIVSIFITGIFAGGLTCLAVQGGLLASSLAQQPHEDNNKGEARVQSALPVLAFLLARLASYTILGLLLGLFGSVFTLSLATRVLLQGAVAIFMIGTALNLLNVHPIFRYFIIQPPRFLTRLVKIQSKSKSIFGPALLGAFTVFIPCGATQAMMAYAVSTGSPFNGALTMVVFILGTSPLFFAAGYALKKFGSKMSPAFTKAAAFAIILVALYNFNGVLALSGSNLDAQSLVSPKVQIKGAAEAPVSRATIYFTQNGYVTEPKNVSVQSGSDITLTLVNTEGAGCIQAFTIPTLGIQTTVPVGKTEDLTLKAPVKPGVLPFMCGMGMYRGAINVL